MRRHAVWLIALLWAVLLLPSLPSSGRGIHLAIGALRTLTPGFAAALWGFALAWLMGTALLRILPTDASPGDRPARSLVALALGWALLEAIAVLCGLLGLPGAPWWMQLLLAASSGAALLRTPSRKDDDDQQQIAPRPTLLDGLAWTGAAALLLPAIFQAGAPPLGPDELQYHLRFVELLLAGGGFPGSIDDPVSGHAQGLHALAASLGGLGAGTAVMRPLHLLFGLTALAGAERLARRAFSPSAGRMALLVAAGSASVLRFLPVFGTDLPLGLFLVAALLVGMDWIEAPSKAGHRPLLLGLLAGGALGIKFTAPYLFGPLLLCLLLASVREGGDGGRRGVRALLGAALLALLWAMPWLVRNQLEAGNPLYPIFGLAQPSEHPEAFVFNIAGHYGAGDGPRALLRTPWDLFMLGTEFDRRHFLGRLNPWPLLALPGMLLALRRSPALRLLALVSALALLLWAIPLRRVVYLLPLWPLLAAWTGVGLATLLDRWPRAGDTAILIGLLLSGAIEVAAPYRDALDDIAVVTGQRSVAEHRAERLDCAPVQRWIRQNTGKDERIALFYLWQVAGFDRATLWSGAEDYTMLRLALVEAGSTDGFRRRVEEEGIHFAVLRRRPINRAGWPSMSDEAWEAGFAAPNTILEATLQRFGTLRYSAAGYEVYEFLARR